MSVLISYLPWNYDLVIISSSIGMKSNFIWRSRKKVLAF